MRRKHEKKSFLFFVIWITFCVAVWFCIYKGYVFILAPKINTHINEVFAKILTSVVVPYGLALPVSYVLLRLIPVSDDKTKQSFSVPQMIKAIIIQSGCSMLIMFVINIIMIASGHPPVNDFASQVSEQPLLYIFLLFIFNPIAEEFIFRKLVLSRLMNFGLKKAVIVSACLFALPHVISQGIPQMFYTFILGLVWGYVTAKTNKLRYAIILHSFSNLWGMFFPMFLTKTKPGTALYVLIWVVIMPVTAVVLLIKNRKKITYK